MLDAGLDKEKDNPRHLKIWKMFNCNQNGLESRNRQ